MCLRHVFASVPDVISESILVLQTDVIVKPSRVHYYKFSISQWHFHLQAVASFSPEEQSSLLKFITACSRAPLLGFKFLEPGLSIQMAGSMLDNHAPDRLPTAATCMNLLKLPPYRSAQQIRDKLLYAAQNASGFGLS